MIATFWCENILCALNDNEQCTMHYDPLKCKCRNDYMNRREAQCEDCEEVTKCNTCEFHPEGD